MKNYYRIALGRGGQFAEEARVGGFICAGFLPTVDLTGKMPDEWREFNSKFVPIFMEQNPERTRIGAGLACGQLWTIAKGIKKGDIVISRSGPGEYMVGEIVGDYVYQAGHDMPHRRPVNWYRDTLYRDSMSEALKNSSGGITTVVNLTRYTAEIESLLDGKVAPVIITRDETVEDPSVFALETHLEDFLEKNWQHAELGKKYDIYEEEGERVGRQYPSDTGPIDILAISKDKKELLVVELKRGRVTDVVVCQIQRYMGYVKDELAESGQSVRGIIIGFEDDVKIHRALSVASNIDFYTYKIQFNLEKKNKNA